MAVQVLTVQYMYIIQLFPPKWNSIVENSTAGTQKFQYYAQSKRIMGPNHCIVSTQARVVNYDFREKFTVVTEFLENEPVTGDSVNLYRGSNIFQ